MGCKLSKVKNERKKDEHKTNAINSDFNNDVLKIYRTDTNGSNSYRKIKKESCTNRDSDKSNIQSDKRRAINSYNENEKGNGDVACHPDSNNSFSQMNYMTNDKRKYKKGEKGKRHGKKNEYDINSVSYKGDNNNNNNSRGEKKKTLEKLKMSHSGVKIIERESDKKCIKNKIDNNSFTGIIKTINNTFMKRKSQNRENKERIKSPSIIEKETVLKKKYKILYKKSKDENRTKGDQNEHLHVRLNKFPYAYRKNEQTKESYNCLGSKKKEELLMRVTRKNKEQLLYYHDFRSMKLKKNTFLYIYEFYKFNSNVFNLFSIMPSHISENVHASKILFESSLIGKYIILPWIENDPDIKNNMYMKYVKYASENKLKMNNINTDESRSKEVNFCGLFNNNYYDKDYDNENNDYCDDQKKRKNKKEENNEEKNNKEKESEKMKSEKKKREKMQREKMKSENKKSERKKSENKKSERKKSEKKDESDKKRQKCNAPNDKYTSNGISTNILIKKVRLYNGNTEKEKEKKYVNNRNFSMHNLFKLHHRKPSIVHTKHWINKNELVCIQNEGSKGTATKTKDVEDKRDSNNKEKKCKNTTSDEGKRILLEKREKKMDKVEKKKKNGIIIQSKEDPMLRNKKLIHKNQKIQAINRNKKKKEHYQNVYDEESIKNNKNNISNMENDKAEKKEYTHYNIPCSRIIGMSTCLAESMEHKKMEVLIKDSKKNNQTKNSHQDEEVKKKKARNSKHLKARKKREKLMNSSENNVTLTMICRDMESRVIKEKEGNRKSPTDEKKSKMVVRITMEENKINGINCHVGKKEVKEEEQFRNNSNKKNKELLKKGNGLRRDEEMNTISLSKDSSIPNSNIKVVKRVKRKMEIHKIPYHQIVTENRNKMRIDMWNTKLEDPKLQQHTCRDNNIRHNDKLGEGERTQMIHNKCETSEALRADKTAQEYCDHKYRLSGNSIKKNYIVCRKCHRKRCIFHYSNGFKLYGWIDYKWTDPDGFLELSVRQKKKFDSWKRLSELYDNPIVMSTNLYNNCIRQGFVADCSFLSSLTVLIEYEKKHKVPVLSSIISPCSSNYVHVNKTWPVFNPSGMYICRLHCNGIQRKIIIDDYVPVKNNNSLLVAYSNNQKELWVTLLEKAFVKLMGGSYSMYGSNPGSDLYYLTGWIPVTISLKTKISSSPPSLDHITMHATLNSDSFILDKKSKVENGKRVQSLSLNARNKMHLTSTQYLKYKKRENEIYRTKRFNKWILNNQNVKAYNRGNMLYARGDSSGLRYDFPVDANLSMHILYRNKNYSYANVNLLMYQKLKIFWNMHYLYAVKLEKEKVNKKRKSLRTNKQLKGIVKKLRNVDDIITKNVLENESSIKESKEKFCLKNTLEREYFQGPSSIMMRQWHGNKNSSCHVRNVTKRNNENIKKISKGCSVDYEMRRNHKNQFLCEEISSMDLSSYVCGSVDQYSYINKRGESSNYIDDEYEEYDERWDIIWNNMYDGIKKGKCVVCLGTLELKDAAPSGLDYPEGVSMSTGIVTRHAYSILNIESYNGDKLLYIKNPWGCIRWKGKYSHHDEATWTKEVQKKLNYSIEKARGKDDGCFWIPWKDVVKYFSHIYICWNSVIFPYQFEIHTKWENSTYLNSSILQDDTHLVAYNPQFALHVNVKKQDLSEDGMRYIGKKPIEIWILLSRHVRERKTDVSQKYLALHIHSGKDRIICPLFPIKQGIYSNGECTFTKLVIGGEDEYTNNYIMKNCPSKNDTVTDTATACAAATSTSPAHKVGNVDVGGFGIQGNEMNASEDIEQGTLRNIDFVLIVSQYSQKEEFNFTLKVFSHTHLSLYELPPLLPDIYESLYFKGQWTNKCAGGCSNNLWSYFRNPHIRFYVPQDSSFCIFLECSQEHSVNLRIFKGMTSSPRSLKKGEIISSGAYKAGCCYIECTLESGIYCLIPSVYRANVTGDYQLCIHYPKIKQKPVLYFIPYSYVVPPFSFFKYQLVHLYSLKNYSVILFHTLSITLLSLRITFFENMNIKGIPFVNIYKLVSNTNSYENDLEAGNIIKNNSFNSHIAHNKHVYKMVNKCNIHGGPGNDILPLSTCAYDYYIKFNSVLIPLVELGNEQNSYLLLITTNIKEDVLFNHEVHFVSDKQIFVDTCYPVQT
ncbi:hypothetical protein, conserved [Plasmodium gonderi]|uniref:Calpain catalytic domain-containing protein n=1 Tax=Plasmodium gonderi TaxID=77519 RepID=A0A1Y1JML1_PLAGO|nr:hypothetical protein, conserved [Plasmodium gonderi]GAW81633.1 hypothetical protein, conserved [Plasmodium gonderi]